jgi:thymidylate synthase
MRLETIEARDLPDAWFQVIYHLLSKGRHYIIDRGSYAGQERIEYDYITLHVRYPGTRPLVPDIPAHYGVPSPVTEQYVQEYLPYLMLAEKHPNEQYTYGQYLEHQIEAVIRMFRADGHNTNQATMTVGDASSIYLEHPPCLRLVDCRILDGKLHFICYFRSWDAWGGLPANLAGLQLMKEYMASEIGVQDGEIIAASKGLHVYGFVRDIVMRVSGRNALKDF